MPNNLQVAHINAVQVKDGTAGVPGKIIAARDVAKGIRKSQITKHNTIDAMVPIVEIAGQHHRLVPLRQAIDKPADVPNLRGALPLMRVTVATATR